MSDRSIRSFALDYYRKRGAEVAPLEDAAETFEIRSLEGATLKVTFADDAPAATAIPDARALTATSPEWRAILEDLTADVAVSYRYLVSAPIADPVRTLTAALPHGWAISAVRLQGVENRVALGFSHRVTFDSLALNARREVMHHHLWDVADRVRLPGLEAAMYDAPTLMIRPEHYPPEAIVKGLLDRSLVAIDQDTDARGATIEAELKVLLDEAETRANQYYEQQMGQVLAREAQLSDKLETTIKRLAEAKSPEAIARHRQDGAALQSQIGHARQNREAILAEIEAACARKLEQERDRHELTAVTDLVALCHASYDVLTYRVAVVVPDADPILVDVRYWPVSKELELPPCPACNQAIAEPHGVDGRLLCAGCAVSCDGCGRMAGANGLLGGCSQCETALCSGCGRACSRCEGAVCADHATPCATCATTLCPRCATACATCDEQVCGAHAHIDPENGHLYCESHRPAVFALKPPDAAPVVVAHEVPQALDVATPTPDKAPATPAPCKPSNSLLAFTATALGGGPSATLEALLSTKDVPGMAELPPFSTPVPVNDAATAADEADAPILVATPPVISSLSGRSLHPRLAETCPACGDHFTVQEMVDCETCGVPACRRCTTGPMAPCPACEALAPTVVTDPRLQFVFELYPELARYKRSWEVANVGPYVVTHWSRWGAWGMVVYRQGTAEMPPAVLTDFAYGRLAAVGQAIGLGKGR